jgi:hypothetical protein
MQALLLTPLKYVFFFFFFFFCRYHFDSLFQYTLDFDITYYGNSTCAQIGALKATGSGDFILHFGSNDWLIGAEVDLYNPCYHNESVPATVVKGFSELGGSFEGLPLNSTAYVTYIIYADSSKYFEFTSYLFFVVMLSLLVSSNLTLKTCSDLWPCC